MGASFALSGHGTALVIELLGLGRGLLADNAEHVAACGQIYSTQAP